MESEQTGMEITQGGTTAVERREEYRPSLIEQALQGGVDVEVIERLVALQERETARHAEVAMAQALAAFQAECPPIPKTGTADVMKNGQRQYTYHFAPLDEIARVIRPHLTKHGLSYVHDTEVDGNGVAVTCTLQHAMGAKRTATFRGPIDTSGGKNPIQQVASAQSYGRRYSLISVLGLTTGEDDDGKGAGGGGDVQVITAAQVKRLNQLADEAGADKAAFCRLMGVDALTKIPAVQFKLAELTLRKKIEAKGGNDA